MKYAELTYDMECDFCGTPFRALRRTLISGDKKSCGCLQVAHSRLAGKTHGLSRSSEYGAWKSMWQRVTNPNNPGYKNYGGRGITIHPEWGKFENFYRDMGRRPIGKSIDRINNNEGYEMNNCRWATAKQQMNNTRRIK